MIEWNRKNNGTEVLRVHEKQGVTYLTFPILDALNGQFVHGFSTRLGGISTGNLASMNLSFTRGDREENVRENFRRIASAVGFDEKKTVFSHQTHTKNVRVVTEADAGKGYLRPRDYEQVDGLVTDVPGLVLTTFYADCVPLFFVDPERKVVGLSHSGWRGTVADIAGETVRLMTEQFGCDPAGILGAIGPSICQDCYEVSEDVIEQFRNTYEERLWPELFYPQESQKSDYESNAESHEKLETPSSEQKYQLNLWEACRQNMLRAGMAAEHIQITDLCTCCNPKLLFSHRASAGKRGNMAAFLGIR